MARGGWSSSNYLYNANAFASSGALTMAAWIYPTSASALAQIWGINNSGDATRILTLNQSATALIVASRRDGGTASSVATTATVNLNSWNFVLFKYFPGIEGTFITRLNSDTSTGYGEILDWPTGLNATCIGARYVTGAVDRPYPGYIGPIALWNYLLNPNQCDALASGMHPLSLPGALPTAFYSMEDDKDADDWFGIFNMYEAGTVTEYTSSKPPIRPRGIFYEND